MLSPESGRSFSSAPRNLSGVFPPQSGNRIRKETLSISQVQQLNGIRIRFSKDLDPVSNPDPTQGSGSVVMDPDPHQEHRNLLSIGTWIIMSKLKNIFQGKILKLFFVMFIIQKHS